MQIHNQSLADSSGDSYETPILNNTNSIDNTETRVETVFQNTELSNSSLSNFMYGSFLLVENDQNMSDSSLTNSFVLLNSGIHNDASIPTSITEQLSKIQESLASIIMKFGETTVQGATFFCGGYTLISAIVAAFKATTPMGIAAVAVEVIAGVITMGGVTKQVMTPPKEVETMLNNADALVSMVKMTEQANLIEIGQIESNLMMLEVAHNEIIAYTQEIEEKIKNLSGAVKTTYEKALNEAKSGTDSIKAAIAKLNLSKKSIVSAGACLGEASTCMIELKKKLGTPITSIEEAKEMLKGIEKLAEVAINANETAQKELSEARIYSDEGQNLLAKGLSCNASLDTYLKVCADMQENIQSAVLEETLKIRENAQNAEIKTNKIKKNLKQVKVNIKENLVNLENAHDQIAKVKATWNRFLSYGAAFVGMMGAMGTIATVITIAGTGLGTIAIGSALGLAVGFTVATIADNSLTLWQILSIKISRFVFGEVEKIKAEDLPEVNEVVIKFDNLSSSLWGKIRKRGSETVGSVHFNIAGAYLDARFDLREQYPIAPQDISKIFKAIKEAIEKAPSSVDLEKLQKSLLVERDNKFGNRHLLGEANVETIVQNLSILQEQLLV